MLKYVERETGVITQGLHISTIKKITAREKVVLYAQIMEVIILILYTYLIRNRIKHYF